MDSIFTVVVFIVIAIASIAQKIQESKQKKEANALRKDRIQSRTTTTKTARPASGAGAVPVRQARPKGAARGEGPSTLQPGTTGKELINALFGEGTTESMEGWIDVASKSAQQKAQRPAPRQQVRRHEVPEHPREAAKRQREAMQEQYARDNDHSSRGHARGISHQRQAQPAQQGQHSEQERQRIMAERQRRKEQQQQQKRQAQQKTQQQRSPRRAVIAPVASGNLIPRTLPDVRRAIIMAEILGPPKAFE